MSHRKFPNYGKKGSGPLLKEGMVIAIEPMVNLITEILSRRKMDDYSHCGRKTLCTL